MQHSLVLPSNARGMHCMIRAATINQNRRRCCMLTYYHHQDRRKLNASPCGVCISSTRTFLLDAFRFASRTSRNPNRQSSGLCRVRMCNHSRCGSIREHGTDSLWFGTADDSAECGQQLAPCESTACMIPHRCGTHDSNHQ